MKTFLFRSMIGIFFGAFISVLVTNIFYLMGYETLSGAMFLKNSLGSMFCGWFFSASPLYFEIESLKLSQQTALHFSTVIILYFLLSLGIGWVPFSWTAGLAATGIFIFSYAVIWLCFYFYFKRVVECYNH